jgi:hypothetical protein
MAAELITLRIFLMGLVVLTSSPDGKKLTILLPQTPDGSSHHYPVLVFPCSNAATCGYQAKTVHEHLALPDKNFDMDKKLLSFEKETFGAIEMNHSEIAAQPLPSGKLNAVRRKSHARMLRWWFNWRGDIPDSADESADLFWMPSLAALSPCAAGLTPDEVPKLIAKGRLAAFMRFDGKLGFVRAFSSASMKEFTSGGCTPPAVNPELDDFVVTMSFAPGLWPFSSQNHALSDVAVIETATTEEVSITITDENGKSITVRPQVGRVTDILIGNLTPRHPIVTCDESDAEHFKMYFSLFDDCKQPKFPHVGWKSTRIAKKSIGQDVKLIPGVLRVVSDENDPGGGLARPICSVVTN